MMFNVALMGTIALLLNLVATFFILKLAHKKELFDQPNHRTVHKAPVPRLGGVGIYWSAVAVFAGMLLINSQDHIPWGQLLVLLAFGILNIVGLYDDLRNIRAVTKFLWQGVASLLVIGAGYHLRVLQIPFTDIILNLGPIGPVVTFFWIVGVSNAINLIDGMDGLAGGISTLGIAAYGIYFFQAGLTWEAQLCAVFVGSLLAFLWYNQPPAKTFMGDSGSILLGTILSVLPLMGGNVSPFNISVLIPVTVVLIPVADTLGAIWRRLRDNRPIFSPDKEHMHHKLLYLGLSVRKILFIVYLMEIVLIVPLLIASFSGDRIENWIKFWLPIGSMVALISFFFVLHFIFRNRLMKAKSHP